MDSTVKGSPFQRFDVGRAAFNVFMLKAGSFGSIMNLSVEREENE